MRGAPIVMQEVTRVLAALIDPTRLRLVRLLVRQELCVCELVDALRMPQYKISRHLRALRGAGIVEARREGRWMHYRLGRTAWSAQLARRLLEVLTREMGILPAVTQDDARLSRRLYLRRAGQCVVGMSGLCRSNGRGRVPADPAARRVAIRVPPSRPSHRRATG